MINNKDNHEDVFQYVSGEMSAAQERRFEEQLEHDQDLRERVAGMVCTLAAADKVFAETAAVPRMAASSAKASEAGKRSLVKVVASLAALVLIGALAVSLIGNANNGQSIGESESIAVALADRLDSEELEIFDDSNEFDFLPASFESDSEWIYEVVDATLDAAAI